MNHLMLRHLLHDLRNRRDRVSVDVVFCMLFIWPDVSQHLQACHAVRMR